MQTDSKDLVLVNYDEDTYDEAVQTEIFVILFFSSWSPPAVSEFV